MYSNDENDEDIEPTCYDSSSRLGYASFNDHIETHPIDEEPIEARPIEAEFYEPPEISLQRTDVRREWSVPGVGDYPVQTIPSIIPSTNEHVL